MSTTTIRIEEEFKARIAAAAQRAGKTTHAFILDAIEETVEQAEIDAEFDRVADERWAKVLATGKTVHWEDARAYLEARARGATARQARGTSRRTLIGPMPRIQLAPEVLDDFDHFFDHLFDHHTMHGIENTPERIADIIEAIQLLAHSPVIGRKKKGGKRELVIGQGARGYGALYRDVPDVDTVFVLAVRSQRESGDKRSP